MTVRTFHIKNFERFQHYKDRSPPWIKLYNELLDDYEFGLLPDATKMHLVAIWLLASRSENKVPFDPKWVGGRINANDPVNLDLLLDGGFILLDQELQQAEQIAIVPLAECLPREREEKETEKETEGEAERPPAKVIPIGLGSQIDPNFQPNVEAIQFARDQGATDEDIEIERRKFIRKCQEKASWSSNWDASWGNWWENWKPHRDRIAPKPKAAPRVELNSSPDWDGYAARFVKGMGWPRGVGPDPDSPACRCPPDILAKHNIGPKAAVQA